MLKKKSKERKGQKGGTPAQEGGWILSSLEYE